MTQFEADTAAAFVALAAAGVEVGVIEAGLGGRLDATNVLAVAGHGADLDRARAHRVARRAPSSRSRPRSSPCCATRRRWCSARSPTEVEAARPAQPPRERPREVVTVRDLAPAVELSIARPLPAPQLRRRPGRRRGDARLARSASASPGSPPALDLHGRMEIVDGRPAADPRRRAQPRRRAGAGRGAGEASPRDRPVVACLAVLADKDAAGIVAALAPAVDGLVATEIPAQRLASAGRPGREALAAASWRRWPAGPGVGRVGEEPDPVAAIAQARAEARERGGSGARHRLALPPALRGLSGARKRPRNSRTSRSSQSVWSLRQPWRSLK